ncbi:hypothetical protein GFM13_19100 [Rhizobium leguminosarum bv. viciae]|nr:hypothetical protein [Rhizobium leguminosarum bv. viciae]
MNSENSDLRQAVQASLGRQVHQRMATFGTVDLLYEAIELQSHGEVIAAKHLSERAIDAIEDGGRAELEIIDNLANLPPVWGLDAALSAQRVPFLEKHAIAKGWRFGWIRGDFIASDEDGFALHVYRSDAWRCSTGMPDMLICGVGLTTLHAHLRGETIDQTVAALAPWYAKLKGDTGVAR